MDNQHNKQRVYMMAKEVLETRDLQKAAQLLQSEQWIAVNAAFDGDDVLLVLIRIA